MPASPPASVSNTGTARRHSMLRASPCSQASPPDAGAVTSIVQNLSSIRVGADEVGAGVGQKGIVGATVGAGLGGGLQPLHEIATSSECPQL